MCKKWKVHEVLSFIFYKFQDIDEIIENFVEFQIDGKKFFNVKDEKQEISNEWGIKKVGDRKNLMRLIK